MQYNKHHRNMAISFSVACLGFGGLTGSILGGNAAGNEVKQHVASEITLLKNNAEMTVVGQDTTFTVSSAALNKLNH